MAHPAQFSDAVELWCASPPPHAESFASGPVGSRTASPLRVLIVEDEVMIAMTLESMVEDFGYEVCAIANTGEDAVAQALIARPDVILMDINLGRGIDGVEAARLTLQSWDARIVFVTAYSDALTLARVRSAAPDAVVVNKPFDSMGLLEAIQRTASH